MTGIKCYNCGKPGHLSQSCTEKETITCYNCNKTGHIAKDCKEPKKPRKEDKGKGRAFARELTVDGMMEDMGNEMKEEMMRRLRGDGFGQSQ